MALSEPLVVTHGSTHLVGERWGGPDPVVVLLHAGVADRRSWYGLADRLAERATLVAYDRRGFGETELGAVPFSHLEDLLAVMDAVSGAPVWLVGSSAGGAAALDAAVVEPGRVQGLVLLAPAVSGAPKPKLDADTERLRNLIDAAEAAGALGEVNRLETWLWLDGPAQPEGRVSGPARELMLAMNAIALRNEGPEEFGASGTDAWRRLAEVRAPVTVACGDLDVPFMVARSSELAARLPGGRHRVLPAMAHLPYLERPSVVADLVLEALEARGATTHERPQSSR